MKIRKPSKELLEELSALQEAAKGVTTSTLLQLAFSLMHQAEKRMDELELEHARHEHFLKMPAAPQARGTDKRPRQEILRSLDQSIEKQARVVDFTRALHRVAMRINAEESAADLAASGLFNTLLKKEKK